MIPDAHANYSVRSFWLLGVYEYFPAGVKILRRMHEQTK